MITYRLTTLRKNKRMTQDDLGKVFNVSGKTVGSWERGYRQPDLEQVSKLADYFDVTTDYLLGRDVFQPIKGADIVSVPLVGNVKAGVDGLALENVEGYTSFLPEDIKKGKEYFALRISGDSLVGDGIFPDDVVLVEKNADYVPNKLYVVIINGEEGTLKHLTVNHDHYVLTSSNPNYPPRILNGKQLEDTVIVGRVVQIKRSV